MLSQHPLPKSLRTRLGTQVRLRTDNLTKAGPELQIFLLINGRVQCSLIVDEVIRIKKSLSHQLYFLSILIYKLE